MRDNLAAGHAGVVGSQVPVADAGSAGIGRPETLLAGVGAKLAGVFNLVVVVPLAVA